MNYKQSPSWLSDFSMNVSKKDGTIVFSDLENHIDDIYFFDSSGCTVGSIIQIEQIEYVVLKTDIYVNKSGDKASVQVDIIVQENSYQ